MFERESVTFGDAVGIALLSMTAAVDVLFTGWLSVYLASGCTEFSWQVAPSWKILAGIAAVAMATVSWLSASQLRGLKEWRELEIDS